MVKKNNKEFREAIKVLVKTLENDPEMSAYSKDYQTGVSIG